MNKILIIPSSYITNHRSRELLRIRNMIKNTFYFNYKRVLDSFFAHYLCTEHYMYGDIPTILGPNNVFIVGSYYQEYTIDSIPEFTRYPSLHKTPLGTHCSPNEAESLIKDVDAVLIGIRSGTLGEKIRKKAIKKDIPVAIIDYFDDVDVYKKENKHLITKKLKLQEDYNLYFKHDLPLGMSNEYIKPIAPMPIRLENYPDLVSSWKNKTTSIFFRGRSDHVQENDRISLTNEIKSKFKDTKIEKISAFEKISLLEYVKPLAKSKIGFSPSGKVWDSTRHAEIGMYNCVPLIPEPNCEVVSKLVKNDINCISYNLEKNRSGGLEVVNVNELFERITFYLAKSKNLENLAKKWKKEIIDKHTILARSKYIIDTIRKII